MPTNQFYNLFQSWKKVGMDVQQMPVSVRTFGIMKAIQFLRVQNIIRSDTKPQANENSIKSRILTLIVEQESIPFTG